MPKASCHRNSWCFYTNINAIQKRLTNSSQVLFYLPLCQRLWRLTADVNHFVALLNRSDIYRVLSDLHRFPQTMVLLEEYAAHRSVKALMVAMQRNWPSPFRYALEYSAMSADLLVRASHRRSTLVCLVS